MDFLRDWLDWFTGYDRRAVRALFIILAINAVFVVLILMDHGSSGPDPLCPADKYAIVQAGQLACVDQQTYDRWNHDAVNTVIAETPDEATPPAGGHTAN